jgi:large repetitive protein
MPSNFPDLPSLNQGHIAGTSSFVWKGRSWDRGPAGVVVPPPTLISLNPNTTPVSTSPVVTVTGANFTAASEVNFGSYPIATTFVSATELTCTAPPNPTAEILQVTVVDGPQTSNSLPFEYTAAVVPTLISLVPNSTEVNTMPAVAVTGTNFTTLTLVRFGATTIPPTFVSATRLDITAPSSPTVKTVQVTAVEGATTSNPLPFNYTASTGPTIVSLDPSETPINTTPSVTVNGTNYTAASVVRFDAVNQVTSYVSATQLRVTAPTSPAVKTSQVTVIDGAKLSNAVPFKYVVPLSITSLAPAYMLIDGLAKEITITGTGFTPASIVQLDYLPVTSTYVSAVQMKFTAPGSSVVKEDVLRIVDGANASNSMTLRWVKSVTVTSVTPNPFPQTSTGVLFNVYGTGFDATTSVLVSNTQPASAGAAIGGTLISSTNIQFSMPTWGTTAKWLTVYGALTPDILVSPIPI